MGSCHWHCCCATRGSVSCHRTPQGYLPSNRCSRPSGTSSIFSPTQVLRPVGQRLGVATLFLRAGLDPLMLDSRAQCIGVASLGCWHCSNTLKRAMPRVAMRRQRRWLGTTVRCCTRCRPVQHSVRPAVAQHGHTPAGARPSHCHPMALVSRVSTSVVATSNALGCPCQPTRRRLTAPRFVASTTSA
jgi:hypothetical protein